MGEEDDIVLQQLLVLFGLVDDSIVQWKILAEKPKLGTVSDGVDENFNASKDQWKIMTFDNLPKETPHNIQTVLKEEQKALISANNDLIEQRIFWIGEQ